MDLLPPILTRFPTGTSRSFFIASTASAGNEFEDMKWFRGKGLRKRFRFFLGSITESFVLLLLAMLSDFDFEGILIVQFQ